MARRPRTSPPPPPEPPDDASRTVTPRLRFPEFREPWRVLPLDRLAERVTTRNGDGTATRVLTNSAEYGILDQRDYFDREIATAGNLETYFVVENGDFVYNPRTSAAAPVGPVSRNNLGQGVMSPLYSVFRFADDETDFYSHFFQSTGWHRYLRDTASTGARHDRMSIGIADFMRMPIPLPSPAEQRRIAACLTSLDELIAAQGRKVEALKAHKKGLMQHLFPREGETRPRLRFPEFRKAGEWDAATIGTFAPFVTSGSRGWAEYYADDGDLFVRITNLTRETIDLDLRDRKYVRLPGPSAEMERTSLRERDILISVTADIGIIGFIREYAPLPAYINQHIALIRFDHDELCNEFVALCLASDIGQQRLRIATDNGTKAGMNLEQVRRIRIALPDLAEQQRIADCLASVDAIIAAESAALAALRTHKAGLMQQLFPAVTSPEPTP